jgi:dolichol-phosphate mannosyltransferase
VVILDGDLQDPPEVIPELVARWRSGAKVVRAERRSRQDPGLRGVGFDLFHRLFALVSDMQFAQHTGVFSLLDRQAVREFNQLPEKNRLIPGLRVCVSAAGFLLASVFIVRRLLGIEIAQTGFTTIVSLILFLGGIQLIAVGLLGEYLGRTYDEVKRRPLYIVQRREGVEPVQDHG